MPIDETAIDALRDLLLSEAARQASAPLAEAALPPRGARDVPAGLAALLWREREALGPWLAASVPAHAAGGGFAADPAADLASRLLRWVQTRHPYLPLDATATAVLEALVRRAIGEAAAALGSARTETALERALTAPAGACRRDLGAFLRGLEATSPVPGVPLRPAVCADHPPALQLRVLGLDPAMLAEPILDLGCGTKGALVAALRAAGKAATGIDRLAEPGIEGISRADWLTAPLPPGSLGTIVSHLGFSLHFLHQHLRPDGDAERYARRYMELLRALRPGGLFAYAPALPFIEDLLPADRWGVERVAVPVPRLAGLPPIPWQAARVTRRL